MAALQQDQLTTAQSVQNMLGTSDAENVLLAQLIPQVSAAMLKSLKRRFVLASNPVNPVTEYYSGSGDKWLILNSWPVQAPILTGNTTAGSNLVTGLPNTDYLFPNQSVVGPGIPTGVTVQSVDVANKQVTLSLSATATATGAPLQFGLAVWVDDVGAWGSGGNAFNATAQLIDGADFALRRDQPDGSSNSAMLYRLNDIWGALWERSGLALSSYLVPGQGNIKVQYWAGYASVPPDLELACIKAIAKVRNSKQYGEALASENLSDKVGSYAYSLAASPASVWGLLGGEVGAILAQYRRLRQGQSL